jgi:integrase
MARAPFVFFARGPVLYAQLWNADEGRYGTAHSTRTSDKNEATAVVLRWVRDGFPVKQKSPGARSSSPLAGAWLEAFWTESSSYVVGKKARGDSISKLYIKNSSSFVRRFFSPRLGTFRLYRITTADLETWVLGLYNEGIAPRTVNCALQAISVGFREATRLGIIRTNPAMGVRHVKETQKERGILTLDEAKRLFEVDWTDKRAKTASLLAAATGLRLGEIRGLQVDDIEFDESGACSIHVRNNWQDVEGGLVKPKYGSYGEVPVPKVVGVALRELIAANPFHGPFVFFGDRPTRPVAKHKVEDGLTAALAKIGIDDDARKARGICFHSWRAFLNSQLRRRVTDANLRKVTRHKQPSMTDRYDRLLPEDLQAVRAAQEDLMGCL